MDIFPVLNHWLHLASVIVWIGGVAFQLLVMAPFLRSDHAPPDYLITLSDRFQKFIGPILFILVITGGINLGFRRAGHESIPPGYISALGFKIFLVAIVASIHFFGYVRSKFTDPPDATPEAPVMPRLGFMRWTFSLGIVIIFIAAMLRKWEF